MEKDIQIKINKKKLCVIIFKVNKIKFKEERLPW